MSQLGTHCAEQTDVGRPSAAVQPSIPSALLDEIACGLIVCGEGGNIAYLNEAALRELASQRLLLRIGNVVRMAQGSAGGFDAALRQAARLGRRSLVRLTRADDSLLITVLPLPTPCPRGSEVLVMIGQRRPCSELGLELLSNSYGLTSAERRVLDALLRQATPREIATEAQVKLSTVRTHISAIRTKLGARNVEGLLLRAAQMPPVASALRLASNATVPGRVPWVAPGC